MLLKGETKFFVCSLRDHSVVMFNFSDMKRRGDEIKIEELHHQFSVKIQEIKEL